MQFVVIAAIIIVILLIAGVSFLPLLGSVLWVLEGFAILCVVFFVISLIMLSIARPKKAKFLEIVDEERYGARAVYEVDGERCSNAFPTDEILEKWLYRRKEVTVRVLRIGKWVRVYDKVTVAIIAIGFPVFTGLAILIRFLIG